jgi:hypothetical protein
MAGISIVLKIESTPRSRRLGIAWIALCLALALHVIDEAVNGFLYVYNPTVLALRAKFGFWPMPTFTFAEWLIGLVSGILLMAACSPFAFRNARWIRPIFYFLAIVTGIFNALGHTLGTILGGSVSTVHFSRPMPGFISSPILFAAAAYALVQLRRTRKAA